MTKGTTGSACAIKAYLPGSSTAITSFKTLTATSSDTNVITTSTSASAGTVTLTAKNVNSGSANI